MLAKVLQKIELIYWIERFYHYICPEDDKKYIIWLTAMVASGIIFGQAKYDV